MACGCPVIVSNTSSLPEVCGAAALYVNPSDLKSIKEGMEKLAVDSGLRENLRRKGIERAAQFSWERTTRVHLKVFEEVSPGGAG